MADLYNSEAALSYVLTKARPKGGSAPSTSYEVPDLCIQSADIRELDAAVVAADSRIEELWKDFEVTSARDECKVESASRKIQFAANTPAEVTH